MKGKSDRSIKLNIWVFVDDGFPEASEYDSNYVSYDAGDPGSLERAMKKNKLDSLCSLDAICRTRR